MTVALPEAQTVALPETLTKPALIVYAVQRAAHVKDIAIEATTVAMEARRCRARVVEVHRPL